MSGFLRDLVNIWKFFENFPIKIKWRIERLIDVDSTWRLTAQCPTFTKQFTTEIKYLKQKQENKKEKREKKKAKQRITQ